MTRVGDRARKKCVAIPNGLKDALLPGGGGVRSARSAPTKLLTSECTSRMFGTYRRLACLPFSPLWNTLAGSILRSDAGARDRSVLRVPDDLLSWGGTGASVPWRDQTTVRSTQMCI